MKFTSRMKLPTSRHLTTRVVLDFLDRLLPAEDARRAEEHLASACTRCRELLREIGLVHARMGSDRVPEVPGAMRARALDVFVPRRSPLPERRTAAALARLVFDSLSAPLPALARRSVGEARRLRFALGDHSLDLEYEAGEPGALTLRGRLAAPDAALHRVDVTAGEERLTAWPDAHGAFLLERVPPGALEIQVTGPTGAFQLPSLTP